MASGRGPRNPNAGTSGPPSDLSSNIKRHIVESAPAAALEVDLASLPEASMPDIEGIEIHVPAPPPLTEADILERFEMMYYGQCVNRNPRGYGDTIAMEDELILDMVGYMGGRVIPFSAHSNLVIRLTRDVIQPGFGKQLEGSKVGETKVITTTMEDQDEFGASVKLNAAFVIEIKGAAHLTFPAADDPETLAKLGLGNDIQTAYRSIAEILTEERANMMVIQGINMAIEAVANRITTPIPFRLIQDEIRFSWEKSEGTYLAAKGLPQQDRESALEGWLQDEATQEVARKRLKTMMALLAYAQEEEQALQREELVGFVEGFAKSIGLDIKVWRAAVADNEEAQASILNSYLYIRTVSHLVAQIPIHYGE